MQAILSLIDFGITPTINREAARSRALSLPGDLSKLLYMFERINILVALVVSLGISLLSEIIANHWLSSGQLDPATLRHAIILMGIVFACRWPIGLYQGALQGAQKIILVSKINIVAATINSAGAVTVLVFISPTIEAFFMWQAIVALTTFLVMRKAAWNEFGYTNGDGFDWIVLKRIWKFSAGMTGLGLSGLILMQLDKVLLSRLVSLEDFGVYSLAGVAATGLYMFLTPHFNVIFPKMSEFIAANKKNELITFYRSSTRAFLALFFPIALTGIIFSKELLYVWTGNAELANHAAPILQLILLGTTLNGVMHFPYALQLANGNTKLPLFINSILLTLSIPLIIVLTKYFGILGGAGAWAILNAIYVLIGIWLTHRVMLSEIQGNWILKDVGISLFSTILVLSVGSKIILDADVSEMLSLCFAAILCISTIGISLVFSKSAFKIFYDEFSVYFRKKK